MIFSTAWSRTPPYMTGIIFHSFPFLHSTSIGFWLISENSESKPAYENNYHLEDYLKNRKATLKKEVSSIFVHWFVRRKDSWAEGINALPAFITGKIDNM